MSRPPQSYRRLVWQRYRRSRLGLVGLALLAVLLLVWLFGAAIAPHDPDARFAGFQPPSRLAWASGGLVARNPRETGLLDPVTLQPLLTFTGSAPVPLAVLAKGAPYRLLGLLPVDRHLLAPRNPAQGVHLLGTDRFGRDILSRGLVGARVSLTLALVVVSITTTVGLLVGAVAGYLGGATDRWLQRLVDVVLAFPQLPLYLALGALIPITLGAASFLGTLVAVMSVLGWAGFSREIRSKTLVAARMDYVRAAVALGASDWRVVRRHILPNLLSHVIVSFTLNLPAIVLLESFLGFLGLAVKPPLISWGLMLQDAGGFAAIGSYPWILSPVGFVFVTVLAFNSVGDALRDAVDPYG